MLKQTSTTEQSPAQLKQQLAHSQERSQFFLIAIQALLYFLKEFSFDLSEIGAEEFKRRLDVLFDLLSSNEHTSFLTDAFDDHKEFILNFIGEERKYIGDRENELMDIITLLRNGLYGVLGECNDYNAKMYQHSRKIEDILSLDDIKHIKQSLQHEVEQMRSNIREKEAAETKRLESLAKEVDSLKTNLEHIKDVSLTDSLTGAYNRLAFDTHIRRHIERNTISWYPFSVLMCDIDNFKSINDTYGHQVGDRVLMCFVHECKEFFRNDDFIARYGGEEFAMILPGTSLRDAMKRAKTFCKDLASKHYLIEAAKSSEKVSFTVSIGCSEAHKDDTPEILIERADQALYQAKRAGKNRAVGENEVKAPLFGKQPFSLTAAKNNTAESDPCASSTSHSPKK